MTVPLLHVDTDDPMPVYEQLRSQLADLIASGSLRPGDRLPPLRQLAADLDLAVGTVGRAYKLLEADDLVRSRRGAGTRVHRSTVQQSAADTRAALADQATAFARQVRLLRVDDADALAAVAAALARLSAPTTPS